jgi:high-affinity nickel-transport protein
VVIVTCVVVAATAGALRERFDSFQRIGGIIGTSVSAAFLLLLCAGNGWVLWRLVRRLRAVLEEQRVAVARDQRGGTGESESVSDAGEVDVDVAGTATGQMQHLEGIGFLGRVFRGVFRIVDRPWKMLPLGTLFGLGFDTSSEIAILGIASIQAAAGTSMWVILIFPALFTGKCALLDSMGLLDLRMTG